MTVHIRGSVPCVRACAVSHCISSQVLNEIASRCIPLFRPCLTCRSLNARADGTSRRATTAGHLCLSFKHQTTTTTTTSRRPTAESVPRGADPASCSIPRWPRSLKTWSRCPYRCSQCGITLHEVAICESHSIKTNPSRHISCHHICTTHYSSPHVHAPPTWPSICP